MQRTTTPDATTSATYPDTSHPFAQLTGTIIASSFEVNRQFGFGFLEAVYRRALAAELRYRGLDVAEEVSYELFHRGVSVGVYRADLVVDGRVIVETKTGLIPDPTGMPQLLNYLSASGCQLGLLIHFGPRGARVKRAIRTERRTTVRQAPSDADGSPPNSPTPRRNRRPGG